jgi:L-seryl-tRNA(Ser) seleniumtransferase
LGRPDLIERIRKNPLSRTLRVDKLTYAAMEATLEAHATGRARLEIPVLRMLGESADGVGERALRCVERIHGQSGGAVRAEILPGSSLVGGGAAPMEEIPTRLVAVSCPGMTAGSMERALRSGRPPVIARIQEDRLVLDLRTVLEGQEEDLARSVASLAGEATR